MCRTLDDIFECGRIVILQVEVDAETCTEGSGEQTTACGSSHEGEGIEVNLYGTCRRSFVDHDVDAVVFHGRIEILFDYG